MAKLYDYAKHARISGTDPLKIYGLNDEIKIFKIFGVFGKKNWRPNLKFR